MLFPRKACDSAFNAKSPDAVADEAHKSIKPFA